MSNPTKTKITEDGLRYKNKTPSGSPFTTPQSFTDATKSCFLCGKRSLQSAMGTRKILGRAHAVCSPSCK